MSLEASVVVVAFLRQLGGAGGIRSKTVVRITRVRYFASNKNSLGYCDSRGCTLY